MTDTTHEAPERINVVVQATRNGFYKSVGHKGGSRPFAAEYVRADLVQAAVAAALREAAEVVRCSDFRHDAQDAILALITPDAQAALDRALLAEVRAVKDSLTAAYIELAAERERCAKVAFDAGCGWQALRSAALSSSWPQDAAKHLASEHAAFAIAAAIRKGRE